MRTLTRHTRWLVLALILVMGLAGCYRSAGGNLEPTPVDRSGTSVAANTPIPMPSFTPEGQAADTGTGTPTVESVIETPTATEPLVSPTVEPAQPGTDTPVPTSVDASAQSIGPSPTNTAPVIAQLPTNTPTPLPSNTPLPTNTPLPSNTPITPSPTAGGPTATFTVQPFNTLPPSPTYTPFSPPGGAQEAVPLAERTDTPTPAVVADADGQGGPVMTETPTPQAVAQEATLSVNQMTATALVFQTTATAAALQGQPLAPTQPSGAAGDQGGQQVQPVTPTFTPAPFTPTPAGACGQHLVAPGDNLYRIALQYNVTVDQMAQANNITNPDLILAGSTLTVPCPLPATAVPAADTSGQGGVTTTTGGQTTYIVEPGDNLYRISIRFGVTMSSLMTANGLTPSTINFLRAGQQLIIPAAPVQAVPAATAIPTQPTAG
jgi:LysM repeat protein